MTAPKPIIVVVDDDLSVLRALRRLLLGAGYDVQAFDRPNAVLTSNLPREKACLVVDVHLPGMSGVELCDALIALGCRLPVVLITGHMDEETRKLAESIHPAAFLVKPFSRDLLLRSINTALDAQYP